MPREASFTQSVVRQLALEANFRCVRPGCYMLTHLWDRKTERFIVLGEGAHDAAASRGGPRYRPNLTIEQRRAVSNGAWLCPTCATRVDKDWTNYPHGTISGWQREAAVFLREKFNYPFISPQFDLHEMMARAAKFCGQFNFFLHGLYDKGEQPYLPRSSLTMLQCFIREFEHVEHPTHKCNTGYGHTIELQKMVVNNLRIIVDEVHRAGCWYLDQMYDLYRLSLAKQRENDTLPDEATRQASLHMVRAAWGDACRAYGRLLTFSNGEIDMGMIAGW
jgi:hypothetical protein